MDRHRPQPLIIPVAHHFGKAEEIIYTLAEKGRNKYSNSLKGNARNRTHMRKAINTSGLCVELWIIRYAHDHCGLCWIYKESIPNFVIFFLYCTERIFVMTIRADQRGWWSVHKCVRICTISVYSYLEIDLTDFLWMSQPATRCCINYESHILLLAYIALVVFMRILLYAHLLIIDLYKCHCS